MRKIAVLMLLGAMMVCFQGCLEEEMADIWGDFGRSDGEFDRPRGVAVSAAGYVYVADTYNHRIQKFTKQGEYLAQWGKQGTADGKFNYPVGIAVDSQGYVYVADTLNHRIQKFTADGFHLMSWGKEGKRAKELTKPCAIAVDSAGYVYVADTGNNRIQKFDCCGNFIASQWDASDNQLDTPCGIAVSRQNQVYVADSENDCIKKFTSQGQLLKVCGEYGTGLADFRWPEGIAIDVQGNVYVADSKNHRLQKFTSEGQFITAFGCYGYERGQFRYPAGLAVDDDYLYVADTENYRIQRFWLVDNAYQIKPSVTYFSGTRRLSIQFTVYDLANSKWISQGTARYLITQDGQKIKRGLLTYHPTRKYWCTTVYGFSGKGEFLLTVVINGQSTSMKFTILSSTTTVRGNAQNEQGELVEGLTVELYRAKDIISDIINPKPVEITTSEKEGFVFNNVSPDRYIIVSEGPTGTAYSPAFWVFGQEEEVATNISFSPSRASLIRDLKVLKEKLQKQMFEQTFWMKEVSEMADLDLVLSPDLLDKYQTLTMLLKSLSDKMRDLDSELASGGQKISLETFAGLLFKPAIVSGLREETQGYLSKVSISGIYPWYLDYADEFSRQKILQALPFDIEWLQGDGNFGQGQYSHSVSDYKQRAIYQQVSAMLEKALTVTQTNFPEPNSRFSYQRADVILRQSLGVLESLKQGTDQIYVVPEAANPYGSLSLHLYDYYNHYKQVRQKRGKVQLVEKVAADLGLFYTGGAFLCLGSVVTAEAAPIFAAAAWVARRVEKVAGYYEEGFDGTLLSAFRLMGPKYLSNLALTPFAYIEVEKFLRKEAESPYYLNKDKSFEAKITNIQLMGSGAHGDKLIAFPQQGPFVPKVLITDEVPARVEVRVGESFNPADMRVETKVEGPLGIYDHSISQSVLLRPGDGYVFEVPFKGCLTPNTLGERSKMEFRLWAGPFQVFTATSDFMVVFPAREESRTKGIVPLSQKELEDYSEQLREKEVFELAIGQNIISRDYQMAVDIFSCQFRAYRPLGVGVRMQVVEDQNFVGYDPELGTARFGFPAEYSGLGSNPEVISIPQAAGRNFKVALELDDLISEPVRVILEVWEMPNRPALMVVLPDTVELTFDNSGAACFSSSIGESSHQQALQGVKIELSELKNSQGKAIEWNVSFSNALSHGIVLAGQIENFEVSIDAQGADEGLYTGQITISSSNTGETIQSVKLIVPDVPPEVEIVQDSQSGNFTLSWNGRVNKTYQIEISKDLKEWSVIDEVKALKSVPQFWTDQNCQETVQRFYRLKVLE